MIRRLVRGAPRQTTQLDVVVPPSLRSRLQNLHVQVDVTYVAPFAVDYHATVVQLSGAASVTGPTIHEL